MQDYKTLIILDWDDTLFPSTWVVKNNIDLNDKSLIKKFKRLDKTLYILLSNLIKIGNVIIVTNAMLKWVYMTLKVLPYTQQIITKAKIISARDSYQEKYPGKMDLWKKMMFEAIVEKIFKKKQLQNIISIGDAEYEFNALTNLYNMDSYKNKRILKTVKLLREPTYEILLNQISILNRSLEAICYNYKHLDLEFKSK